MNEPEITGYRKMLEHDINIINEVKRVEQQVAEMLVLLAKTLEPGPQQRWLAMARTNLETGFMYWVKAVANPTGGLGRNQEPK